MSQKFKDRKSKAVSQAAYETKRLLDRKMKKKKLQQEISAREKEGKKVILYERATSLILTMIANNPEKEWSVETIWKELNAKADHGIKEYQNLFYSTKSHEVKTFDDSIYISKEDVEFIIYRLMHHKYIWKSSFDLSPKHFPRALYKYNEVHWLFNKKTKQVLCIIGAFFMINFILYFVLGIPYKLWNIRSKLAFPQWDVFIQTILFNN